MQASPAPSPAEARLHRTVCSGIGPDTFEAVLQRTSLPQASLNAIITVISPPVLLFIFFPSYELYVPPIDPCVRHCFKSSCLLTVLSRLRDDSSFYQREADVILFR